MTGKKILIIEDDAHVGDYIAEAISRGGYKPYMARTGKDGLQKLKEEKIDAILLDRQIPEIDGMQVLQAIRKNEKTKDLPVIMVTGTKDEDAIKESLALGIQGYLVKPVKPADLTNRLEKILKSKD